MNRFQNFLRKWLRWEESRQANGYTKLLLAANPFLIPFDCHLLRYAEGSQTPPHRDPVRAGRHFRLNIVLKHAPAGGEFICSDAIFHSSRLNLFRSDICTHSVTQVKGGSRYVLSFGWVLS